MTTELTITAALLGVGLAMDAFSVSLANGLEDQDMNKGRMTVIAGTFAGFQFAMPLIGWFFVHTAESKLEWFSMFVPWIALLLLLYIGGKMLKEGIEDNRAAEDAGPVEALKSKAGQDTTIAASEPGSSSRNNEPDTADGEKLKTSDLIMQGIATSIDALSVGFTIAAYELFEAVASSLIIGVETFVICMAGLAIGKKMGTVLAGKASILGGLILIGIGLEIWIKGVIL